MYGRNSPPDFPERLITITFTPGDDTEPQLTHPVTLKGIKSDTKQLNIVLTIGKKTYDLYYDNFANSKQVPQLPPLQCTLLHMVNCHELYTMHNFMYFVLQLRKCLENIMMVFMIF